jgi:hypothetical protein
MGNHIHLIVEAADRVALTRGAKGLAIRIARGLNRLMGSRGQVIAERYHARILRTPTEVRNAVHYVLANHAHHFGRADPGFTSARHPSLVVGPSTWLLCRASGGSSFTPK